MRKMFPLLAVAILFSGLALFAQAKDEGKTVTVVGEGQCAKCSLQETKECENAIVVEEKGTDVTYYLPMSNPISKKFHGKICKAPKKVKATGTVKEEDGKKILDVTSLELVETK